MRLRRDQPDPGATVVTEAVRAAVDEARAAGTALVGDVSNTLSSLPVLDRSPLAARVFFELVRFRDAEADETWASALARLGRCAPGPHVRVSVAPHAPYSVSPRLFQLIRNDLVRTPLARTSIHLCESREECELLWDGTGPWRDLLEEIGAWDSTWVAPACSPVEYLESFGMLGKETLVVHGVHLSGADLHRLAASGATIATCPRSNRHVGVGDPPVSRFYEVGVPVAVGTDSLASVSDLNVFNELAAMRRLAPNVAAGRLLESATRIGALALGFDDFGMIAPGARAALIAVDVPVEVDDIEEYLVSGISPEHVRWPLADLSEAVSTI
jgi:cytosine/adenosine deaminase-related metal-dependent hydrolase